jgi:DNA-binding transcriptional MerR regulator
MSDREPHVSPGENPGTGSESEDAATAAPSDGKMLRRAEVARKLGTSVSTVRRLEAKRVLRPKVAPDGVRLFPEEHVRELVVQRSTDTPEGYDGPTAAEVFTLLDEGVPPVDVVKRLKIDPRALSALLHEWARLRGGFVVTFEDRERIENRFSNQRPIPNADALFDLLGEADPYGCVQCSNAAPKLCATCAKAMNEREARQRAAAEKAKREQQEHDRRMTAMTREFRQGVRP